MKNKKVLISIMLFVLGAIGTYIAMCYYLPGVRIKLDAGKVENFAESMKSQMFLKGIISVAVGAMMAYMPWVKKNK